jgi:hypothetical protein
MYSSKEIEKSLLRKGFVSKPGDHVFLVFYHNDKATMIRTKLSRGSSPPGKPILREMKKQLQFKSQDEFERLIDCPMSKEEYEAYLEKEGCI